MNIVLVCGIIIVNFALISYTVFFFTKSKVAVTSGNVAFLVTGVFFDLVSTILMIIGSHASMITFHGVIGYTALAGMILEAICLVKYHVTRRALTGWLSVYTGVVYFWWIFVYLIGVVLVMHR